MTEEQIEAAAQIILAFEDDDPEDAEMYLERLRKTLGSPYVKRIALSTITAASKWVLADELAAILDVACALVPYTNVTWHKMENATLARHRELLGRV
jgi:hypothetical protein